MDEIGCPLVIVDKLWCVEFDVGTVPSDSVLAESVGCTCKLDDSVSISATGGVVWFMWGSMASLCSSINRFT